MLLLDQFLVACMKITTVLHGCDNAGNNNQSLVTNTTIASVLNGPMVVYLQSILNLVEQKVIEFSLIPDKSLILVDNNPIVEVQQQDMELALYLPFKIDGYFYK